ncbi:MarR family winged helix-turn-helix transcriptional regulator [Roseovarius salinarum]|uniref:MarR family winged helix-turn-helix transcriptional regulator n=1 Tax=Roseovarius salinarum TaxID=1981892 RepID=UPI000C31EF07|nr:MarR family winged helix-turn-helix transcriptional regulator [Roseovarius salinarum]
MSDTTAIADRIAEMLVHLGRTACSEDGQSGLTAAQWTCLRFFSHANRTTCTPSAFASFHATTRGTASQIVKTLERRGLVCRERSPVDGRSVCFALTEAGWAALSHDPLGDLIASLDGLGPAEREAFLQMLSRVASTLAARRGGRTFGTCSDCTHFSTSEGSGYCACMAAHLGTGEIDKLCIDYSGADHQVDGKQGKDSQHDSQ